ncbi:hypothetical protein K439DRAFT_1619719 [Ramaria rubella]|nr:hypothetical protein K439DRAFT_1619719 [Ramaria rubella]
MPSNRNIALYNEQQPLLSFDQYHPDTYWDHFSAQSQCPMPAQHQFETLDVIPDGFSSEPRHLDAHKNSDHMLAPLPSTPTWGSSAPPQPQELNSSPLSILVSPLKHKWG